MHKSNKKQQNIIVNEMVDIHRERGSQTKEDLIRAGYSSDQVDTCAPLAAQRIAELDRQAA